MHPDIEALRPKLKEILYDCAVEIRATKAALYLYDGASRFDLTGTFGFKVPIREWADSNDPIVDRCGRGRTPFIVNGLAAEPRLSESLYESQTDRMLVVPLYMRGQLVGVLDMRDKAAKQPFEQVDVPKAQKIADRVIALFANKNVFGQRFISLSGAEGGGEITRPALDQSSGRTEVSDFPAALPRVIHPPAPEKPPRATPPVVTPAPLPAAPAPLPAAPARLPAAPAPPPPHPGPTPPARTAPAARPGSTVHTPRIATIVLEAHQVGADILAAGPTDVLGESELASVRDSLRSTLSIPGAIAAMFSAFPKTGGLQELVARSTPSGEAVSFLQSRLNIWLSKRGESGGVARMSQQALSGPSQPPIEVSQIQKVFTAPVSAGTLRSMYLTVAFSGVPDRNAHELLAENLNQMQNGIEHSLNEVALHRLRINVAERLLEPDFSRYPALRHHTDVVVGLVERFARELELSGAEAEQSRLVAIVHDVGMRLLEYEKLYQKRDVTADELGLLREHVFVGAALVEPLLGRDVAVAVLSHHERIDGRGYPNELVGEAIPFAARVVQICDAYAAMTDSQTYQPPESPAAALEIVARGAGSQFDSDLAARFVDMMRSGR